MEKKVAVRYQRSTDFEDSFPEAGTMTESEALLFFDGFPFEADCAEWPELPINSPYPTIHFRRPDNAYARVQMQEVGEYIIEIRKGIKRFEILFNSDFNSTPRKETREFLSEFLSGNIDEKLEWLDETENEGFGSEPHLVQQLEFHYKSSWKHWIIPEIAFVFMGILVIYTGNFVNRLLLIVLGSLVLLIPANKYLLIWRLTNQIKGSHIAILPDKHSFLWEKDGIRRLIHRDEIKKCSLIHFKRKEHIFASELRLVLKDGSRIRMNTLLFDPFVLILELRLKYTVL